LIKEHLGKGGPIENPGEAVYNANRKRLRYATTSVLKWLLSSIDLGWSNVNLLRLTIF
jgi:hypothetical protein